MVQLTKQQQKALTRSVNISVTAGAGTGKTLLLVERYIDILLKEDVDIKEILAITFTKKAAAEMKERVAKRVEELINTELPGPYLRKLMDVRDRLNSVYISTVHSFCARILREFPVESGLDPDFRQINEMQQRLIVDEVLNEEIAEMEQEESQWLDMFRLFGETRITEMLQTALDHRYEMEHVLTLFDDKDTGEIYSEYVNTFYDYINTKIDSGLVDDIINCVANIIHNKPENLEQNEKAAKTIQILSEFDLSNKNKDLDFWQTLFNLADFFTKDNNQAYVSASAFGNQKIWGKELSARLITLSEFLVPVLDSKLCVPSEVDNYIIDCLKKFYVLYKRFLNRYKQRKNDLALVDYDDLQILALRMLLENPDIKTRLENQYRFIMVDEFQDTNDLQWDLISQLGDLNSAKFFVVADPKQSIYGFRNADIRVFTRTKKDFKNFGGDNETDIVLKDSFRFSPQIGEFINRTFSGVLHTSPINPWEVGYENILCKNDKLEEGDIDLAILSDDDQTEFLVSKAQQLSERYNLGDMAVLLRTRTHLSQIEEAFRKNNIPFRTIGGIGFYQRQEIYDTYHLVRFLINQDDDNALVGLLRSPFANISDEGLFFLGTMRKDQSYWQILHEIDKSGDIPKDDYHNLLRFKGQADKWINRRDHINFSELLYEVFEETYYRASMAAQLQGERFVSNLEKIMDLAVEFENSGFLSLVDFSESLQNLINKQNKESEAQTDLDDLTSIKIMTIHQAKGLEFKVVFLPYLEQESRSKQGRGIVFSEEYGIAAPINPLGIELESGDNEGFLLDYAQQIQNLREIAELKRLFYVGCSRAVQHLALSMSPKYGKIGRNTPADWLSQTYNIDINNVVDGEIIAGMRISTSVASGAHKIFSGMSSFNKNMERIFKTININNVAEGKSDQLLPLSDEPEAEIFSASQIMAFERDRNKYERRYHFGFFEDDYNIPLAHLHESDLSLILGKIVHKILEKYPVVDMERIFYELDISDEVLKQDLKNDIDYIHDRIKRSLHLKTVLEAREYRNEVSILMAIDSDFLSGTIDKMYINNEGIWEVIDYKTNRITEGQIAETAAEYTIQTEVYALLMSFLYPDQKCYPVMLYFTYPDLVHRTIFNKEDLNTIGRKIGDFIMQLKQFDPYKKQTD